MHWSSSSAHGPANFHDQLDALVLAHETQPRKLITPFWGTISPTAVKQLQSKPQIVQTLTQFISMELAEFLERTQSFTLPYLVRDGYTEIIQRIAHASRGPDCSVQVICHDNIASILPVLLVQDVPNPEKHAMRQLISISSEFSLSSLSELVRPDAFRIAAELLKMAGDAEDIEDQDQRKRVRKSFVIAHNHILTFADPSCAPYCLKAVLSIRDFDTKEGKEH
jgi:serine/threonine-protein kinase ATR